VALVAVLAALVLPAGAARAIDIDLGAPHVRDGRLNIDLQLTELFAPRVQESLGRGMPARLQITGDLWRHRTGWFDRLSGSFVTGIKIRYDVWSRTYRIEAVGMPERSVSGLDSVRILLSRTIELPLAERATLPDKGRYYAVVSATLKPLSVEDVEEGEGWLSGEVAEKRHSGIGVLAAIPRSVFDAVRNFAGLGDQRVRAISDDFELDEVVVTR